MKTSQVKWNPLFAFVLLCACALHARADDSIHKCSRGGGAVAYRSQACLPGERRLATLAPVPEVVARHDDAGQNRPAPRAHATPARNTGRRADRREHQAAQHPQGRRKPRPKKNPCVAARQGRDDFQRRRGIRITMAELSRWNHRVYDACK